MTNSDVKRVLQNIALQYGFTTIHNVYYDHVCYKSETSKKPMPLHQIAFEKHGKRFVIGFYDRFVACFCPLLFVGNTWLDAKKAIEEATSGGYDVVVDRMDAPIVAAYETLEEAAIRHDLNVRTT